LKLGSHLTTAIAAVAAAAFAAGLCFGFGGQEDSPREQAAALISKAKKATKANHAADAYLLYSQASALEPKNSKLKGRMEALQSRAAIQAKAVPPADPTDADAPPPAPDLAPEDVFDSLTAAEYAGSRQLLPPPALNARPGLQDFDITGDARSLFDQVAQRFGLDPVYDSDYPPGGNRIRFRIPRLDYREALHDLEAITNSFVVPLSAHVFMVALDTPQKRNDLEQSIVVAVPVPAAMTTQQLTEIAQAVKQATNIDKIAWDTTQDQIVIRDRISRALPAQALLQELMAGPSQVMLEVEFLDVADSDIIQYGFNVTNQFAAIYLGDILNSVPTIPSGVTALLTFGGGKTLFGLTAAQAQAMFNQTITAGRTLFRAQVRSVDKQAATLHIGDKYPVITQQYAGSVPAGTQGTVYAPPPSFTYEDLGVEVKVTPYIHGLDGVTLACETSFELLEGTSINGIPVIGRRQFNTQVRLRDGEWAVVAGLKNPSTSKSTAGFWGLERIPLIGNLFKQVTKDKENENVLVAIRPHLLALPPDQSVTRMIRVGSATRPFTPL
jgi:general secretion pathway protein D